MVHSLGATEPEVPLLMRAAVKPEKGPWRLRSGIGPATAVRRYTTPAPDGVRLMQLGKAEKDGLSSVTGAVNAYLQIVRRMSEATSLFDWAIVGDLPAGPRQLGAGFSPYAGLYVIVVEPTSQSAMTGRRMARLARGPLGADVIFVASKVSSAEERRRVERLIGEPVTLEIPADQAVRDAERRRVAVLSGTIARALGRSGQDVMAIDAHVNPMLGISLGLGMDGTERLAGIRQELSESNLEDAVHEYTIEGLIERFGEDAPDGVRVVVASRVDMPDHGCLCCGVSADRLLRDMDGDGRTVLGDLEAGVGVLTRMEVGSLDLVLVVANPTPKSIEVVRRAVEAAAAREIKVLVIANRVADDADLEAIRGVLGDHEIVVVPEDPIITRADAERLAPIDVDDTAPGVRAIIAISDRLVAEPV